MKAIISILIATLLTSFNTVTNFLSEQKKYARVKTAINEKEKSLSENLKGNGLEKDNFNVLMVAYKEEGILEIYAKKKTEITYKKLTSYTICARSGEAGPKRKYGDNQVPEGFYYINRFNPTSSFYLSLGLNYPNESDQLKSKGMNAGGDIFIHGSCVTIGCLPMTDDKIKEIYLYAVYARNNGQLKIPVYIFPFKMTEKNRNRYKVVEASDTLAAFWQNILPGYEKFEKEHKELTFSITRNGDYSFH